MHYFEIRFDSDIIERGLRVSESAEFSVRFTIVPIYDLKSGIYT